MKKFTRVCVLTAVIVVLSADVYGAETLAPSARLGSEMLAAPVRLSQIPILQERFGAAALDQQYQALQRMGDVRVSYAANGTVHRISNTPGIFLGADRQLKPGESAADVLQRIGPLLLAGKTEELVFRSSANLRLRDVRVVKLDQRIRGIPVLGGQVNLEINDSTGQLTGLTAMFLPDRGLEQAPKLSKAAARALLLAAMAKSQEGATVTVESAASLAYAFGAPGERPVIEKPAYLIWLFDVSEQGARGASHKQAWVDAIDGVVLGFVQSSFDAMSRTAYPTNN